MEEIEKYTENNNPLVSIVVITYNSAKYVLETLESAKAQTYQNIELIVSDDCSTDNTVEICRNWIDENNNRFVRTELITVEKNTGIAPNCNRGLYKAEGEWVKFIAGDDLLKNFCVEFFMDYRTNNLNAKCIFSTVDSFYHPNIGILNTQPKDTTSSFYSNNINGIRQHKLLIENPSLLYAPAMFVSKNLLINIGGFDEQYSMMEDYACWLKITERNIKIHFLRKSTVLKRNHMSSTSFSHFLNYQKNDILINKYNIDLLKFQRNYIYKFANIVRRIDILLMIFLSKLIIKTGNKGYFNWLLFRYFVVIPPSEFIFRIKKKLFQ